MNEYEILDSIQEYEKEPVTRRMNIDSYVEIYKSWINEKGIGLELGVSSGYSIRVLANLLKHLDAVDGSKRVLDNLTNIPSNVSLIYELFENLKIENKYDYVFASYVLEHVDSPAEVLDVCYKVLKPGGKMFITVPNANALSRQMAVERGMLRSVYELSENDKKHGHRRVFDWEKVTNLINQSKFRVLERGGTHIKQFADFQLAEMFEKGIIGNEQIMGMQKIAKKYPELSGALYVILSKEN